MKGLTPFPDPFELSKELAPFAYPLPLIAKKAGVADYELIDPVNEILEMAIKRRMPELTTMGMLYMELSKLFPSFAVDVRLTMNFERESDELRKWIEKALKKIPPKIRSLYFTQGKDEIPGDEDLESYSISLLGAESYDEDFDWIYNAELLTEKQFHSETLDDFFEFRNQIFDSHKAQESEESLSPFSARIGFLEDIVLYGYCSLLIVKALRTMTTKELFWRNTFFGIHIDNELISHRSLYLTPLFNKR